MIPLAEAVELIKTSGEVKIEFEKRTTKTLRLIRCVFNAPDSAFNQAPPQKAAVDIVQHHLLNIYDLDDHRFKSIPFEGIRKVEVNGQWFDVQQPGDAPASESEPRPVQGVPE